MTLHEIHLTGCAPSPLAWYLKAIAILRLISEQADPAARGAWRDEHFVLWSRLDREGLMRFFADQYAPTPMISPWNKGSGFMGAKEAPVKAIESSEAPRLAKFREGIAAARALTEAQARADAEIRKIKDEAKGKHRSKAQRDAIREDPAYKKRLAQADKVFKGLKADLIPSCRREWRGPHLEWLDAALVLTAGNEAKFPSILGTGGNDGNFDMTNNVMQRIGELLDLTSPDGAATPAAKKAVANALFGDLRSGLVPVAIGQFLPGGAGGANSTNDTMGDPQVNPWDFVLALEGTIAFRAHAVRKLGGGDPVLGAAPFAAYSHATGYGSASTADEGGRGEQWMPLWSRPASWAEVQALFCEGRAQVGRTAASRPLDLVRAFTRLGVARGLDQFVRYGYIKRNGQSNLAVALDRLRVQDSPRSRLIDDVVPWIERLVRKARDKNATARIQKAERRVSDAVFDAIRHPDAPYFWQAVLLAMAEVEALLVPGTATLAGPIPTLQPAWIAAADDGAPEFRLAVALGTSRISGEGPKTRSIREHFLPLERGRLKTSGGMNPKVASDPSVVMEGEPVDALLALVERRLIEAETGARRRFDPIASPGAGARLSDLALFIDGALNERRIVALARAFAAVKLSFRDRVEISCPPLAQGPEDAWLALRIAHLARPLPSGRQVPADPAIVRRVRSGDASGGLQIALRRLGAAGLFPPLRFGLTDPERSRRWGAALAFPVSSRTLENIIRSLFPASEESAHVA